MKRLLGLLLALILVFGITFEIVRPVEARAKKVHRKFKHLKYKKPLHKKQIIRKKKVAKKIHKKAAKRSSYRLPNPPGAVFQTYSIEEGVDESEADNMAAEIKSIGVQEASINIDKNTLSVKFDPAKVSALKIISKLKSLGYTVKRID
jgi:copper chaperone CopZ